MYLNFFSLHRTINSKNIIYFKLSNENFEHILYLFNNSINTNNNLNIDNKIYLIYSSDNLKLPSFKTNSEFNYINYQLDDLLGIINIKNNFIFKNRNCKYINLSKITNIYNNIKIENKKWDNHINITTIEKYIHFNNELVEFLEKDISPVTNEVKNYCLFKNIKIDKIKPFDTSLVANWNNINHKEILDKYNKLKCEIINLINNIDDSVDYEHFLEYNVIKEVNNTNNFSKFNLQENMLENVYYHKNNFYNLDGKLMKISFMDNDYEYGNEQFKNKRYKNITEDLSKAIVIEDKNMFFLDYIYGWYNFGEFWDCLIRLVYKKDISKYQILHCEHNRIYDINYYFDKLKLEFPNKNKDLRIKNNDNITFHFKKIHFTNLYGVCRGYFDNHISYRFNKKFNNSKITDKNYILYLKRGSYGRELRNENKLINELSKYKDLIIIDGKESIEDMISYWTNAVLVIGAHGSLFKNMIYCKKNPLFIELCPLSRHICFLGNGRHCNFLYFFITLPNDDNENIILENKDLNNLIELIDEFIS